MGIRKSMAAVVLAATMLAASLTVSAAQSPTQAPVPVTTVDKNTKDHNNTRVEADVSAKGIAILRIEALNNKPLADGVKLTVSRDKKGNKFAITALGDGKKGVFSTKKGKKVKRVTLSSTSRITVKAKAFYKSNVELIRVNCRTTFSKNAFSKTSKKDPVIKINVTKSSMVTFKKGCFNGLNKDAVIKVSKKMSKKEYNN